MIYENKEGARNTQIDMELPLRTTLSYLRTHSCSTCIYSEESSTFDRNQSLQKNERKAVLTCAVPNQVFPTRKAISYFCHVIKQSRSCSVLMPNPYPIGPVGAGKVVGGGPNNIIHSKQVRLKREIKMFLKLNLSL